MDDGSIAVKELNEHFLMAQSLIKTLKVDTYQTLSDTVTELSDDITPQFNLDEEVMDFDKIELTKEKSIPEFIPLTPKNMRVQEQNTF